jgi:hypothetical protein
MRINSSTSSIEPNYLNWDLQNEMNSRAVTQLSASNFQDIFNLTRRIGDIEVKMNKIKFRAQGIGGMIGIAAGSFGGPLGSIIGFGLGRSAGSFFGNGMAQRYYGAEQAVVNEHLFMARQRDTQLKYQIGQMDSLGSLIGQLRQNKINDDKKIIQDMMVL